MEEKKLVEGKKLPEYEAPEVTTYTDKEIFEMLGPAHAGSVPSAGNVLG